MSKQINKVAVIGAGVMGAGIAAQAANGGAEVLLLDIVPEGAEDRNVIAQGALDRFIKAGSRGGLMHPSVAERMTVGNIEDDLDKLADCDWIVEVIVERLDIKQDLYHKIAKVRRSDAIVSSNTSTIPLAKLVDGLPEDFKQHFVVTHYFNPPRHMRLVEVVGGVHSLPEVVERVSDFNDRQMGKTVINCADRPGFIGNRLGVFWLQHALNEAIEMGLTVEQADAVMKVCGFPKTGIFGLWDLVGIDLMPNVAGSLGSLLPESDDMHPYTDVHSVVKGMLEKGYKGRKGRVLQGFYRQSKDDSGNKVREVIDLNSLDYRAPQKVDLASAALKPGQIKQLIDSDDLGGQYAWRVLSQVLHYATKLIPDVAADVDSFDQAMKLGYNWRFGPYQLIDAIGLDYFVERLQADGVELSPFLQQASGRPVYRFEAGTAQTLDVEGQYQPIAQAEGIILLEDIKRAAKPVQQHSQCAVWDLDDDVWCLEFTAKVPALNLEILAEIRTVLDSAIEQNKALVLYSGGPVFVAGADLKKFVGFIDQPEKVNNFTVTGQQLFQAIQDAPVPVVGALSGVAMGGGIEMLLHCHAIQAHAECSVGLVENLVGIVPGWGGCKEMLLRSAERFGGDRAIAHTYGLIQGALVTASALDTQAQGFLRDSDGISMNLDRLLFDAKQQALALRQQPRAAVNTDLQLSRAEVELATEGYQADLEKALLEMLNQAAEPGWYGNFFEAERATNTQLFPRPEAKARMEHFLATGKPLRN